MKAVIADVTIPRYLATRALGRLWRPAFLGPASPVRLVEIPEPRLPGPEWVKVRNRLGGVCGSDVHLVTLETPPSASVFASMPFVIGHENVGVVVEAGARSGVAEGTRVVVEPLLPCAARGFEEPCPACRRGDYNICSRFAEGTLSPGIGPGACRDVGGSWGEFMVAHRSSLVPVPEGISDEAALLVEPLAVALHAVVRCVPEEARTVLVAGGGAVGLSAVVALRALRPEATVVVIARYDHQADLAGALGAAKVISSRGVAPYREIAALVGARMLRPLIGPPVLTSGVDVVLECVGTSQSIDSALRLARAGGAVALVGLASAPRGVDWTPIWLREVSILGSFTYAMENLGSRRIRTVDLAMELIAEGRADVGRLVTHRFPLDEYRRAIEVTLAKRRHRAVKVVLQIP